MNTPLQLPRYILAKFISARSFSICLVVALSLSVVVNAQQGYYWTFASSSTNSNGQVQFNSIPATSGTTGSQYLTGMGGRRLWRRL